MGKKRVTKTEEKSTVSISKVDKKELIITQFSKLVSKKIATDIEESIQKYTNEYCNTENIFDESSKNKVYINKCKSIYDNLDPKSEIGNTKLITRIKTKDFNISRIAFLTPQELFPEHWNKLIDKQHEEDEIKYSKTMVSVSEDIKCPRCFKKRVTYFDAQVRCSDEPMTTFYTCLECRHRWKN